MEPPHRTTHYAIKLCTIYSKRKNEPMEDSGTGLLCNSTGSSSSINCCCSEGVEEQDKGSNTQ